MDFSKLSGGMKMLMVMGGIVVLGMAYAAYVLFGSNKALPESKTVVSSAGVPQEKFVPNPGEELPPAYANKVVESDEERARQAAKRGVSYVPAPISNPAGINPDEYERVRLELEKEKAKNEVMAKEMEAMKRQLQLQRDRKDVNPDVPYYRLGDTLLVDKKLQDARRSAVAQQLADSVKGGFAPKPLVVAVNLEKDEGKEGNGKSTSSTTKGTAQGASVSANESNSDKIPKIKKLIPSGTILYATLDLTANSDAPGPVVATLQDGPDEVVGAKVIGTFTKANDFLVIQFNRVVLPNKEEYPISAYAVDPALRQASVVDEVDNHWTTKIAASFGAAWLQGIGEAYMQSGTITPIYGNTTTDGVIKESKLSGGKVAIAGLGKVGESLAAMLQPYANRPSTVIKYANTSVGVLFL